MPRWARKSASDKSDAASEGGWWRRVVELAAFVAVPPALLYVLGLAAFYLGLSSEYDNAGLNATWYAASLVPKTAAAGYGVGVVWKGLIAASLAASVLLFVAYWPLRWRASKSPHVGRYPYWLPILVPIGLLLVAGLLWIAGSTEGGTLLVSNLRISGALLVGYFLPLFLLWRVNAEERQLVRTVFAFYPRVLYEVVASVAIICVVASALFPGEARLPCLYRETVAGDVQDGEVLSPERAEELGDLRTLEGGFLTRSEGRWYVFDRETLDLKAIPDDEASRFLRGAFYIAYQKIDRNGKPVDLPVSEEERVPNETYILTGDCRY